MKITCGHRICLIKSWCRPFSRYLVLFVFGLCCCQYCFAGPTNDKELQQLLKNISTSYQEKLELLNYSKGTAVGSIKILKLALLQDDPVVSNAESKSNLIWTADWYNKGDIYRFDLRKVPSGDPEYPDSTFPNETLVNTVGLKNLSFAYYPLLKEANITPVLWRSVNPYGMTTNFRIEHVYAGNSIDNYVDHISELYKILQEPENDINRFELQHNGKFIDLIIQSEAPQGKKVDLHYRFDTQKGCSLVHASRCSNVYVRAAVTFEDLLLDRETADTSSIMMRHYTYDATYEESTTHPGIWLISKVRIYYYHPRVSTELMEIEFDNVELEVESPEDIFTLEGLGVAPGDRIVDKRDRKNTKNYFYKITPLRYFDKTLEDTEIYVPKL